MFDGAPEQFHHLIAPRNSSLPFPPFDAHNPSPHHHLLSPLHHKDEEREQEEACTNLEIHGRQPQPAQHELLDSPWTDDEVLALLRIRSSLDAWFPELTWQHVSRKLVDLGFKRSAEKCKEKFEEETSYLNNIHYTKNNSCHFISELEQLYQPQQAHQIPRVEVEVRCHESKQPSEKLTDQELHSKTDHTVEDGPKNDATLTQKCEKRAKTSKLGKLKRHDQFEILKGFCENVVKKMIAKQEQMHNRLLEDMMRRDQEIFAREEARKKQEMDTVNRELEMIAKEGAVAGQRQAAIIDLLKKISDHQSHPMKTVSVDDPNPTSVTTSCPSNSKNPNPFCNYSGKSNPEPLPRGVRNRASEGVEDQNPDNSSEVPDAMIRQSNGWSKRKAWAQNCVVREKEEVGRRWPMEEVRMLIKLRCSAKEEREGGSNRVPVWERISEGIREMGYERSAKRCKEK
ncbi:trihelix transcription factor GTL2-like [Prosopis cineraria]|uniref:trihelix transcription factor GTL2-like n=1 Tax=Prosopis cineraria TaxID=364024 RepID=UPI00240F9750|nr:trihelix transcription factor GTL2-like [Prosopis cineraria]